MATFALSGMCACRAQPQAARRKPPPAPTSANAIPIAPLSGRLLGQAFAVDDARYYLDRRKGYEKIDVRLSASKSKSPCGDFENPAAPSVWLRRTGSIKLVPGKYPVSVRGGAPWQVHYQVHEHGRWLGNGDANALFVVNNVGPDLVLHGALQACFRDTTGSCVGGHFAARYCTVKIDAPVRGTEAMERPPPRPLSGDAGVLGDAGAVGDARPQETGAPK